MEVKITKRTLLLEVNNDKTHNYYYYVRGRINNDDKTKYKKFGFVVWFDIFDLSDYYESNDVFTKKDILNYLDELICSNVSIIKSYDDCKNFYEFCKNSIDQYNAIIG